MSELQKYKVIQKEHGIIKGLYHGILCKDDEGNAYMTEQVDAEIAKLKDQLEEANQEIASLQQCDCIIRSAE